MFLDAMYDLYVGDSNINDVQFLLQGDVKEDELIETDLKQSLLKLTLEGDFSNVELVINLGGDIQPRDEFRNTPLQLARNSEIVPSVMEKKANGASVDLAGCLMNYKGNNEQE